MVKRYVLLLMMKREEESEAEETFCGKFSAVRALGLEQSSSRADATPVCPRADRLGDKIGRLMGTVDGPTLLSQKSWT